MTAAVVTPKTTWITGTSAPVTLPDRVMILA